MTIKKPMKTEPASPAGEAAPQPAAGGATIADRFKLDMPDPSAKPKSSGGVGATIALVAALAALGVAGILVFIIYQHWEFLQSA